MNITALKCNKCQSIIWSRHRHDFRWCKCRSIAIDGGRDYTRVIGVIQDWKSFSVDIPKNIIKETDVSKYIRNYIKNLK